MRCVVENYRNYQEAHHMISKTPIALPAIFSFVGIGRSEECVIER
jgi:hypothetical protein